MRQQAVLAALVALLVSGCSTPPQQATTSSLESFHACEGTFPDGDPVHCEQEASLVEVEASVPPGWLPSGSPIDTNFDEASFYRNALGTEIGVWFAITPRSEGDFASPHPTRYGGFLRIEEGTLIAWESEAPQGFVRYPAFEPLQAPLEDVRATFLVYIPVINSEDPVIANATFEPLWDVDANAASEGSESVRVVLKVDTGSEVFFVHEGQPEVETIGYSAKVRGHLFHVYDMLSCGCLA